MPHNHLICCQSKILTIAALKIILKITWLIDNVTHCCLQLYTKIISVSTHNLLQYFLIKLQSHNTFWWQKIVTGFSYTVESLHYFPIMFLLNDTSCLHKKRWWLDVISLAFSFRATIISCFKHYPSERSLQLIEIPIGILRLMGPAMWPLVCVLLLLSFRRPKIEGKDRHQKEI